MKKGTITKKQLEQIEHIITDYHLLNEWVKKLKYEEPGYYEWINMMTGKIINDFNNKMQGCLPMGLCQGLAYSFMSTFLAGWLINTLEMSNKIDSLMGKNEEKEFEKWLNGELPVSYYKYGLRGIKRSSSQYKAKKAYLAREFKEKEMNIFRQIEHQVVASERNKK